MFFKRLSNGMQMPFVGLGTYQLPTGQMTRIIHLALEFGYRKFDTARYYRNEELLGEALFSAGIPRSELFITTKIDVECLYWSFLYHGKRKWAPIRKRSLREEFNRQLDRLKTDYVDLYLLHAPIMKYFTYWGQEISELYRGGLIKSFGVCSFEKDHFALLKSKTGITPMVNQIEFSPLNTNEEVVKYCQDSNICVEGFATLGTTKKNNVASKELLENESIVSIGRKYQKTPAQVILRWAIQNGVTVIPKATSENHLRQNIDLFDFELNEKEMFLIDGYDQHIMYRYFK